MTSDERVVETLSGPGLMMRFSLVPPDTRAFGFPVAQIDEIELGRGADPDPTVARFVAWLEAQEVRLVSCRLDSLRLEETMLLEDLGFRFVEMVYRPVLRSLPTDEAGDDELVLSEATAADQAELVAMASSVFATGRHVLDPRLEPEAGHQRYGRWLEGALTGDDQLVLKATIGGVPVGFFVVEERPDGSAYWHLTAVAPEWQGRGVGQRIWQAVIARHQAAGVRRIETTVSAHNTPIINLYAGLGFRFTAPQVTFHWWRM